VIVEEEILGADKAVRLHKAGCVAWMVLSRPEQMNALNGAMVAELHALIEDASADDSIRVVILTGSERAFCAGADLKEVLCDIGDASGGGDFLDKVARLFAAIRSCPKPVIAGLNGLTMAGGLELALCCDIAIASEAALIGDAHANFGVFPGGGGAAVLPRRIGQGNAKYLLFTGDSLPADRLQQMGVVQEVVPDDCLAERLTSLANHLAQKSPLVLRQMKTVANASMEMSEEGALRLELATLRNHARSQDFQEGLAAFREKRVPNFTGR